VTDVEIYKNNYWGSVLTYATRYFKMYIYIEFQNTYI